MAFSAHQQTMVNMSVNHVPRLPNELILEIASHIAEPDLINFRCVSKIFQAVSTKRFAATFFRDRYYELSPAGLKGLVHITQHALFAPFIRNIIIGHGGAIHRYVKYHEDLKPAFENLAALGNTISIGLRRVRTAHNFALVSSNVHTRMFNFLRHKLLHAAREAQLTLGFVIADLRRPQNCPLDWHQARWNFYIFMAKSLAFRSSLTGFKLVIPTRDSTRHLCGYVNYYRQLHLLEATNASLSSELWYIAPNFQLEEIRLTNCNVNGCDLLHLIACAALGSNLKRLSLYDVHLFPPDPRLNRRYKVDCWTVLFIFLNHYNIQLERCELGNLWDGNDDMFLGGGDQTIRIADTTRISLLIANLANFVQVGQVSDLMDLS
jgi:hypothetical protein